MLLCTRVRSISARLPPPADAWLMALSPFAVSPTTQERRVVALRHAPYTDWYHS